jgi:tight adherence protein C
MHTLIIALLAGITVASIGGAVVLLIRNRKDARVARQRALGQTDIIAILGTADAQPRESDKVALLDSVQRLGKRVSGGQASITLREQLAAAGWHQPSAASVYLGAKAAMFLIGLVLFALVLLPLDVSLAVRVLVALFGAAILSFVPNFVVSHRRSKRRKNVDRHLPDAVDLLEICVSSGMGLDSAWAAVSDEIRGVSQIFADEMELTTLESSLGVPRADALRHMAKRTGVEDLSSLVALIVQADHLGASIADALTTFARGLREMRAQRAEESAEKMSVKLMFPMVLFIFPALLLVMVGPAVLQLVKVIGAP